MAVEEYVQLNQSAPEMQLPIEVKAAAFDVMFQVTDVIHFIKSAVSLDFIWVNQAYRRFFGNGGDISEPRLVDKHEWLTKEIMQWEEHDRIALRDGFWRGEERVPLKLGYEPDEEVNPYIDFLVTKVRFQVESTGEIFLMGTGIPKDIEWMSSPRLG